MKKFIVALAVVMFVELFLYIESNPTLRNRIL